MNDIIKNTEKLGINQLEILFEYKYIKKLKKQMDNLKQYIKDNESKTEILPLLDLYMSFKNTDKTNKNINLIFEEPIFTINFTRFYKYTKYCFDKKDKLDINTKEEYMNFMKYLKKNYKSTNYFDKYFDLFEQIYYFYDDLSYNRFKKILRQNFEKEFKSLSEIKYHYNIITLFQLDNINIDYYNLKNANECINSIDLDKIENYIKQLLENR